MAFAILGLTVCGVGSASAQPIENNGTSETRYSDPGPKPRIEDFTDLTEYLLALLRWLYALNGGNVADLEKVSVQQSANLVAYSYGEGLNTLQARSRLGELTEASNYLAVRTLAGPDTFLERQAMLRASFSIQNAILVFTNGL